MMSCSHEVNQCARIDWELVNWRVRSLKRSNVFFRQWENWRGKAQVVGGAAAIPTVQETSLVYAAPSISHTLCLYGYSVPGVFCRAK